MLGGSIVPAVPVYFSWLANRGYLNLERQAEAMIDLYLDGLRGRPAKRPPPARNARTGKTARRSGTR